jgi:hypothetical protein
MHKSWVRVYWGYSATKRTPMDGSDHPRTAERGYKTDKSSIMRRVIALNGQSQGVNGPSGQP